MAERNPMVACTCLGCPKNLVDSEKMLAQLALSGMVITDDEDQADVIVINTCGFVEAARRESLAAIREAVERKRRGSCRRVVVAGCLAQRAGRDLLVEEPGIDALVGVNNRDDIVAAAQPSGTGPVDPRLGDYHPHVQLDDTRFRLTPRHYAYLRLSEGCSQRCTFCTIPSIRGPLRSKPLEPLLAEARELIADGARELILIGQETSSYGHDWADGPRLADVLARLNELDGVRWIRLMYAYPTSLDDATIEAIAAAEHVVKYIDLPLQHIADRVLRAMHRRIDRAGIERLLEKLRRRIAGVSIRTTFIAGFPGETEGEFRELLRFIRDFGFDMLGVFPYSQEPGTPAARMPNQVPEQVKRERVEALMLTQQEIAFQKAEAMLGRTIEVLLDGSDRVMGPCVARHAGQAPQIDSVTLLTDGEHPAGSFLRARVVARSDYDLVARPL